MEKQKTVTSNYPLFIPESQSLDLSSNDKSDSGDCCYHVPYVLTSCLKTDGGDKQCKQVGKKDENTELRYGDRRILTTEPARAAPVI